MRQTCTMDNCEAPRVSNGLCENHRNQTRNKAALLARKEAEQRMCAHCGEPVPTTRRYRGPFSYCSAQCKGKARTANGKAAEAVRRSYYRTTYGLSMEEVEALRTGCCEICGTTEWMGAHGGMGHIDHDHSTGEVRGLLCSECNTGLGKFKDDPQLLEAAMRYLARSRDLTP